MNREQELRRLIGLADCCELMARTWAFPDEALAQALVTGAYGQDVQSCLVDAGATVKEASEAQTACGAFAKDDAAELNERLRKGYSILFLTPGGQTPVWPYEAPYRHVAEGQPGLPGLFRTPITLDVEAMMQQAGVVMRNARKEPADSMASEFAYLSYAYGKAASALESGAAADAARVDAGDDAGVWIQRARAFTKAHLGTWVDGFMADVARESSRFDFGGEYAVLARVGKDVAHLIESDPGLG